MKSMKRLLIFIAIFVAINLLNLLFLNLSGDTFVGHIQNFVSPYTCVDMNEFKVDFSGLLSIFDVTKYPSGDPFELIQNEIKNAMDKFFNPFIFITD